MAPNALTIRFLLVESNQRIKIILISFNQYSLPKIKLIFDHQQLIGTGSKYL